MVLKKPTLALVACVLLASSSAVADPPKKRSFAKALVTASLLEGSWSLASQLNTTAIEHSFAPFSTKGAFGHLERRFILGGSESVMLATEAALLLGATHDDLWFVAEANYRTDWMVPLDLPACARPGENGGCGVGMGGFTVVQLRPRRWHWWLEAGGGWLEQRIGTDVFRTLSESTLVLTPISAVYELATDASRAVAVRSFIGPGIYGGLRSAHLHATELGAGRYHPTWTTLYPLASGVGPGGRAELRVTFARRLFVGGDLTIAPFLVGGPAAHVSKDVAPLDVVHHGSTVWRSVDVGVGWQMAGLTTTAAFFAAELSERPIDRIGYRGAMLRFDVPIEGSF